MADQIEIIVTAKDRASGPLRDARDAVDDLDGRARKAGGGGGGLSMLSGALGGIGKAALSLGGLALGAGGALAAIGISSNAAMEQTETAFGTLLGSGEKAAAFLDDLRAFSAATPFEFPELADSAKKLLAMGFAAESIIPMMTTIGDTVGALGGGQAEIDRVTMALGQMQAKGKVSAEEMMQLAELGIPAWGILAKTMGLSTAEVMKLAEQGLLPADAAIQALLGGMNETFGGAMAAQAQTFNGVLSTLKDNAMLALQTFTGPLFEASKGALNELATAVSSPAFQEFAAQMGQRMGEAITQFAGWLQTTGIPAAQQFIGYIQSDVIPALTTAYEWLQTNLPVAIQTVSTFWTDTLQPAIQTVAAYIVSDVIPALTTAYEWLQTNLPVAIQTLSDFWTNTLQPAIQTVSTFVTTTLIPALTNIWTWLSTNIPPAIEALSAFWTETLLPAMTDVWTFITDSLVPLWTELTGLIKDILDPTGKFTDALKKLGDYISGALKTGFEWLKGILGEMPSPFETLSGKISGMRDALGTLRDAIGWVIDKLKSMRDLIQNMPSLGGSVMGVGAAAGAAVALPARALGGPVTAGQPYIVGERGPEVFMPRNSGTIVPNNQLTTVSVGNITVNGATGMNERLLAHLVREEINAMAASSAARRRM